MDMEKFEKELMFIVGLFFGFIIGSFVLGSLIF